MLLKQEPWVFDTSEWKTVAMASQLCVRLWWWWSEVLTIWHYRNSNIIIITTTTLKMFFLQKRYKNKQCLSVSSVSTWKDRCVTGRIIFEVKWSYLVSQKRQDSALKFSYDPGSQHIEASVQASSVNEIIRTTLPNGHAFMCSKLIILHV